MKSCKFFPVLFLALNFFGISQGKLDSLSPSKINHLPTALYIPTGFDDNDNSQVTISGQYPNSCYQVGPSRVRVNTDKKSVFVEDQVYKFSKGPCLQMLVDYVKTIDLGLLEKGKYQLFFRSQPGSWSKMNDELDVKESNIHQGPDDHVYAPVEEIRVNSDEAKGPQSVTLLGHFGSSCMQFEDVKVIRNDPKVIEILPIVRVDSKNQDCQKSRVSFEKIVKLDGSLSGKILIHVRSLNGQALNRLVEFF